MSSNKVVIVSKFFPPGFQSSGRLLNELYEDLKGKGYNVTVFTGQPEPCIDDGSVVSVSYSHYPKTSKWGRIREEHSFFKSIEKNLHQVGPDTTLILTTSPANMPYLGALFKKRHPGSKYILIVYDVYPEVPLKMGYVSKMNPLVWKLDSLTKKGFAAADTVIAIGEDMEYKLSHKVPGLAEKISVIPNWADSTRLYPTRVKANLFPDVPEDHVKFVYTGNIGLYYDLEFLVHAAAKLKDEKCSFIFIGEGLKKGELKALAHKLNPGNIHFYPYFPDEEYNQVLNSADVLMLSLREGLEGYSVPSKFYSYLAVAKPVLAMISANSDIGKEIEDYEIGSRVDPRDINAFVTKALFLIRDAELRERYGDNGLALFKKSYTRKLSFSKYLQIISNL